MRSTTNPLLIDLVFWLAFSGCFPARGGETLRLESPFLGLRFNRDSGTLLAINNKLTGETYGIVGDHFSVETTDFHVAFRDAKLMSLRQVAGCVEAAYSHDRLGIQVTYALKSEAAFRRKANHAHVQAALRSETNHRRSAEFLGQRSADRSLSLSEVYAEAWH